MLRVLFLLLLYGSFAVLGFVYYTVSELSRELPRDLASAMEYEPNRATRVYSANGELIGEFSFERRVLVPPDRIPEHVRSAFVSAEDGRFWQHPGFDITGIVRAAWANYRSGATKQGASTITQQVTRMLLLSNERTYSRKIKELILSVRVERELSKHQVLHIYLNHVYLGRGAYGVGAGAEAYFGKDVHHLTIAESALLAGLVQAPSRYSPHRNPEAARTRQRYVLGRMRDDGAITHGQLAAAQREPLAILDQDEPLNHIAAPYFVEHVRRWAQQRYGTRSVFNDGMRIYTTLDTRSQLAAEAAVRDGLLALDRDIGFRGPLDHLDEHRRSAFGEGPLRPYFPGLQDLELTGGGTMLPDVTYVGAVAAIRPSGSITIELGPERMPLASDDAKSLVRWRGEDGRRIEVGDLLPVTLGEDERGNFRVDLAQQPDVQGALVAIEPPTGRVIAMVGGYDYLQSQFNRATQAKRQIGSAIKPFIYATALENGITQLDVFNDAPVAVRTVAGVWAPKNYDNTYKGPVTLRTALAKSLNTVSVRLLVQLGVDKLVETMRAVGIASPIPRHISIALGTPDLTLLEVAAGYAAFANGGMRVEPRFVDRVTAADGTVIDDWRRERPHERALSPEIAYLTTDLMTAVVARGTGRKAQALGRPTAGKTGTSTGHRDAWFFGFTADLVAGVWLGRDDFTPVGGRATGGGAALPIWLQFMQHAHPDTAVRPFPAPSDIRFVRADENTGRPAPPGSWGAAWIPFARGTVPPRFAGRVKPLGFVAGEPFWLSSRKKAARTRKQ